MFSTVVQGILIITVSSLDYCLAYVQPPIHVFLLYVQVGKHQNTCTKVHVYSHRLCFEDYVTALYPHYTLQKCISVPNFGVSRWGQIVSMDDIYIAETQVTYVQLITIQKYLLKLLNWVISILFFILISQKLHIAVSYEKKYS